MEAAPVTKPAVDGALDRDLPCVRCGYNLRGLLDSARCPECGLATFWSLRAPSKLSQYPAQWVGRMAFAVQMLLLAYGGVVLLFVGGALEVLPKSEELFFIICGTAAVWQMIGMWMLSASSGHYTESAAPINRWTLRIAPVGIVIAFAAGLGASVLHRNQLLPIAFAGGIVGAAAPPAIFIRLRTVARMISDPGLSEHSAIVGWGFLVTIALIGLMIVLEQFRLFRPNQTIGLVILLASGVSMLLFLLWGAFIFFACAVDFGRAAKVARTEWNNEDPPVSSD